MASFYSRNYRSSRVFHGFLTREVERRFELQKIRNQQAKFGEGQPRLGTEPEHDGLQWLIDTAPKKQHWSVDRLVGEIMGIWYGSVHTLTIVSGVWYSSPYNQLTLT